MAVVCTSRYFILGPRPVGPSNIYFVWDKQLKIVTTQSQASITDAYVLTDGSVIDVVENAGIVYLVTKATFATNQAPVNYIQLSSTSGSFQNVLVSAKVVGYTLTVIMYSVVAKETTTYTFPMQEFTTDSPAEEITPCFNDYQLADNTIITAWCDGFVLNEVVFTESPYGVSIVQTSNSVTCGYNAPIGPFRFSEYKEIRFENCVLKNPLYVLWKNWVGGWEYWMFQKKQDEVLETQSLGSFQENYVRISDTTNPEIERGKAGKSSIIAGAKGLSESEKAGLKGLLLSNMVYIINQDGSVSRKIKITQGSFVISNDSLEIQIEDAQINTIQN